MEELVKFYKRKIDLFFYPAIFDNEIQFHNQIKVFSKRLSNINPFNIQSDVNFFSFQSLFETTNLDDGHNLGITLNKQSGKIEINIKNLSARLETLAGHNLKQVLNENSRYLIILLLPPQGDGGYENEFQKTSDDDFYFVATTCDGHWEQVIIRAMCKLMGLGDEYENTGQEYEKPERYIGKLFNHFHPNLLYSDTTNSSIPAADTKWGHLSNKIGFDFPIRRAPSHPGQADLSIPTHNFLPNNIELWEGGGGYRTHIYRSAHDCLMRRQIGNKNLPVREAVVPLCPVCAAYVQQQILQWGQENRVRSLEFRGFMQQL